MSFIANQVLSMCICIFNVLPGDPAQMVLDQNATEVQLQKVKKKYGFDLPIGKQYLIYLNDLAPISFHSKNINDFTFYSSQKYGGLIPDLVSWAPNVCIHTPQVKRSASERIVCSCTTNR